MTCCDATQAIIYTILAFTNSVYSLASLFLPIVFQERAVPGVWVGLVFSMYSIAVVIVSPVIGKIVSRIGFANLIAVGLILMGISIIPIGFLPDIQNDHTMIALAIFLRALQGAASASINSTCYSLAANKYADNVTVIVGLLECFSGVGLVIGLLGGSILYEGMGYRAVYTIFGSLLLVLALVTRVLFAQIEKREKLDALLSGTGGQAPEEPLLIDAASENECTVQATGQMQTEEEDDEFIRDIDTAQQNSGTPSYKNLLGTPRFIFACGAATLSNIIYAQLEPILALRCADFKISTVQTSIVMSIPAFFYIIGTLLVPHIPSRIQNRFMLISSCFLIGIALFLVGPSQILGFSDSLTLLIIGLFFTANLLAPMTIPCLPEMLDASTEKYPQANSQIVGDYSGALFSTFLGLGQVIGPLYGATTYAALNFRLTQDILAIFCIAFSILYFFFADGARSFRETFSRRLSSDLNRSWEKVDDENAPKQHINTDYGTTEASNEMR